MARISERGIRAELRAGQPRAAVLTRPLLSAGGFLAAQRQEVLCPFDRC